MGDGQTTHGTNGRGDDSIGKRPKFETQHWIADKAAEVSRQVCFARVHHPRERLVNLFILTCLDKALPHR
jgi:hypothetical protein